MKTSSHTGQSGVALVEVVIASAIILGAVLALLGVHALYLKTALGSGDAVKAAYLAEEGLEAARFLRDNSWSVSVAPLSLNTDYGVLLSGSMWQATAGSNMSVENFERKIRLSAVNRDASGDIVSSGGTLDPDTRLVTASVSWISRGATTTRNISTYLTNLYGN